MKETAAQLGVCERTLRKWMRERDFPYARVGQTILVRPEWVRDWLEQYRQRPKSEVQDAVLHVLSEE